MKSDHLKRKHEGQQKCGSDGKLFDEGLTLASLYFPLVVGNSSDFMNQFQ